MELDDITVVLTRSDFDESVTRNKTAWSPNDLSGIAATMDGGAYAVAFGCPVHGADGCRTLTYGDAQTGKVLWSVKPEPVLQGFNASGDWTGGFTEITMDEDRVFVYGSHLVGMSLQAFERKTGKLRFIFASISWTMWY